MQFQEFDLRPIRDGSAWRAEVSRLSGRAVDCLGLGHIMLVTPRLPTAALALELAKAAVSGGLVR